MADPRAQIEKISAENGCAIDSVDFAKIMDKRDPFSSYKDRFHFPPTNADDEGSPPAIYLCGNSLGLQPKIARDYVLGEMDEWAKRGVEGHFHHSDKSIKPWVAVDENVHHLAAEFVVGAKPEEVAIMGGLTSNLHFMLVSFFRPTEKRYKILMEAQAFPSDRYAVQSQVNFRGLKPERCIIELGPREGETYLRTQDILDKLEVEGETIALVMFSGIQYYTGQFFEMEKITAAAHDKGCLVGWDLAHAAGNVPLQLHDWGVDFAVWCSYKYLNSGPGGIAGIFVHERHGEDKDMPRFAGWWGHKFETRFDMLQPFDAIPGAFGFRMSNPPVLQCATLFASLMVFKEAGGVTELRKKAVLLTAYLEMLLDKLVPEDVDIITPRDVAQRGCQLSLTFKVPQENVLGKLQARGVICDVRKPSSMRIAPTPLYNSFEDVQRFVLILKEAFGPK